jgi:hypothetical protein
MQDTEGKQVLADIFAAATEATRVGLLRSKPNPTDSTATAEADDLRAASIALRNAARDLTRAAIRRTCSGPRPYHTA